MQPEVYLLLHGAHAVPLMGETGKRCCVGAYLGAGIYLGN